MSLFFWLKWALMYSALPVWCDSSPLSDAFNRVRGDGTLPHKCVKTGFNIKRAVTMVETGLPGNPIIGVLLIDP